MLADVALALFILCGGFCLCVLGFTALKRFDADEYEDEEDTEEAAPTATAQPPAAPAPQETAPAKEEGN